MSSNLHKFEEEKQDRGFTIYLLAKGIFVQPSLTKQTTISIYISMDHSSKLLWVTFAIAEYNSQVCSYTHIYHTPIVQSGKTLNVLHILLKSWVCYDSADPFYTCMPTLVL